MTPVVELFLLWPWPWPWSSLWGLLLLMLSPLSAQLDYLPFQAARLQTAIATGPKGLSIAWKLVAAAAAAAVLLLEQAAKGRLSLQMLLPLEFQQVAAQTLLGLPREQWVSCCLLHDPH